MKGQDYSGQMLETCGLETHGSFAPICAELGEMDLTEPSSDTCLFCSLSHSAFQV